MLARVLSRRTRTVAEPPSIPALDWPSLILGRPHERELWLGLTVVHSPVGLTIVDSRGWVERTTSIIAVGLLTAILAVGIAFVHSRGGLAIVHSRGGLAIVQSRGGLAIRGCRVRNVVCRDLPRRDPWLTPFGVLEPPEGRAAAWRQLLLPATNPAPTTPPHPASPASDRTSPGSTCGLPGTALHPLKVQISQSPQALLSLHCANSRVASRGQQAHRTDAA